MRIYWRAATCNAQGGTKAMIELHSNNDVDVIFGPFCSSACVAVAYYIAYYNIPFFPDSCIDGTLSDKSIHSTLVRLTYTSSKNGIAFAELFTYFNWTRTAFFVKANFYCVSYTKSINEEFSKINVTIAQWLDTETYLSDYEIDQYLLRLQEKARIIISCQIWDLSKVLYRAYKLGMRATDYVFIEYQVSSKQVLVKPWQAPGQPLEQDAVQSLTLLKQVAINDATGSQLKQLNAAVAARLDEVPWNKLSSKKPPHPSQGTVAKLHDATYLYLMILNETLANGQDHRNGTLICEKAKGRSFQGVLKHVALDQNADRNPDYFVWHLLPNQTAFTKTMHLMLSAPEGKRVIETSPINWGTTNGLPPLQVPVCGFLNELCHKEKIPYESAILITAAVAVVVLVMVIGLWAVWYRREILERELQAMTWKVKYEDIIFVKQNASSMTTSSNVGRSSCNLRRNTMTAQHTQLCFYQGTAVIMTSVKMATFNLARAHLQELKAAKELNHDNVNTFVGACVDAPHICILYAHCSKGSLQDILQNDDINLDMVFKLSMITDLLNGMHYITNSPLKSHGQLTSSCCLINSRWVLKVSAISLNSLRRDTMLEELSEYERFREMMWTAPELLYVDSPRGTTMGDVYSFGIILQEILFRNMPYFLDTENPKAIIERVQQKETPPFRPQLPEETITEGTQAIVELMRQCWEENWELRPTFEYIKRTFKKINNGRKCNIMDNMVELLEKYANNLEEVVQTRTSELIEEKHKTDMLLYRLLPASVAEKLKVGKTIESEIFEQVTIYFSDIVGFTEICSTSTPFQVVDLLNDLYSLFDDTVSKHDVYKVETIGDAYMVVSGLPQRNGNKHASEIADMALNLLSEVSHFRMRHRPDMPLLLRIGLHSGSCAAGVVGITMPRYCLFGDTVNMASRMESTGKALKIHLSESTHDILVLFDQYTMELRGEISVKGKGHQTTYWLTGNKYFTHTTTILEE